VAVKVQRPGLRRQFDVDLATMRFLTSAVTVAFPRFDFSFLVPEFRDRLARVGGWHFSYIMKTPILLLFTTLLLCVKTRFN
jgi:hypothetical protein